MSKSIVKNSGIYKITNTINGKCYIGSSINCIDRINHHKSRLLKNCHHSIRLQNSVNKHGIENFKFEIIEEIELNGILRIFAEKLLTNREQHYIEQYNSYLTCYGYNILRHANYHNNKIMTEEEKEVLRKRLKGKKLSPEHYAKMMEGMKTRDTHIPSGEEIERLIERNKNKIWTEEKRKAVSNRFAKLTEEDVKIILKSNDSIKNLALQYHVVRSVIDNVKKRRTYKWVIV